MYLALYDLSGIQQFIFATNRLREIKGASFIVSKTLFENIPKLLGDNWVDFTLKDLQDFCASNNGAKGCTIYIGGGNALVLFKDADTYRETTYELEKEIFLQTGGALRLCHGAVAVEDLSRTLKNYRADYMRNLEIHKNSAPPVITAPIFAINEQDNDTFEPILLTNEIRIPEENKTSRYNSRSKYLKLRAEEELEAYEKARPGVRFTRNFDRDETNDSSQGYLAVVHIDGNAMGSNINEFIDEMDKGGLGLLESLIRFKEFSKFINNQYTEALRAMIGEVYQTEDKDKDEEIPFRLIVNDGDDITFICKSEHALPCIESFLTDLQRSSSSDESPDYLPSPESFGVGMGVAFIGHGFPFSTAYDIAEQLTRNAKVEALKRAKAGLLSPIQAGAAVSSLDFQVCMGEMSGSLMNYRNKHYKGDSSLIKRPYHFNIAEDNPFSYGGFKSLRSSVDLAVRENWIAKSKLEQLHGEYLLSKKNAEAFVERISVRDRQLAIGRITEEKPQKAEAGLKKIEEFFDEIQNAYIKCNDNSEYARLFDVLDLRKIAKG